MQSGEFLSAFPGLSFTPNEGEWSWKLVWYNFQSCDLCHANRGHVNQSYANKDSLISPNQSWSKGQVTGHTAGQVYHIPLLGV